MTRRRHPAIALVLVALACVAPISGASAQAGLPPETTRAVTISGQQAADIGTHIEDAMKHFGAQPPEDVRQEVKKGKEMLLTPLKGRDVSVAFRQEYSKQLVPKLQPFTADKDDFRAANALIIAGELATSDAMDLAEKALADERGSVRCAAAYAMGRTFDAVTSASPAIFPERLQGLTNRLAEAIRKDKEPLVVLAGVKGLERAMSVDRNGLEAVRSAGLVALTAGVRDRAKAAAAQPVPEVLLQALTNAGQAAREALVQNAPRLALSPEGIKQAAELNGHLLALVVARMQANDYPHGEAEARELPAQAVSVAETAIGLAAQKAGSQAALPRGVAAEFKKATPQGDTQFLRLALELFRVLHQAPFSFPPGTFLKGDGAP